MKTISAEEANKISCSNNSEVIERDKEIQKTIEDCIAKIENAAKVGNFSAKCYCRIKHLNDVRAILGNLGYHTTVPDRQFEPWHTTLSTSITVLEVSWDCLD
jgi:hypothetical protein